MPEAAENPTAEKGDTLAAAANPKAAESREIAAANADQVSFSASDATNTIAGDDTTPILALIDADEGAHLAMENDAEFEELPHPLARTPVSKHVTSALAPFGVVRGDDTFAVAEKLARVNPLLRHRVF